MSPNQGLSGLLPPEMEHTMRTNRDSSQSEWPQSPVADKTPHRSSRTSSSKIARTSLLPSSPTQTTIRPGTLDLAGIGFSPVNTSITPLSSPSHSLSGGEARRRGIVFQDEVFGGEYFDSSAPSLLSQRVLSQRAGVRPRTRTMDESLTIRHKFMAGSNETRHRMGSLSSSTSNLLIESDVRPPPTVPEAFSYGATTSPKAPESRASAAPSKDKRFNHGRQAKHGSIGPHPPMLSLPPSADSLLPPIPTDDANRILLLMQRLCGRMKGVVEYQNDLSSPWYEGVLSIDDDKGSLVFDSGHKHNRPFAITIIEDLRGCTVLPCKTRDGSRCLELSSANKNVEIIFRPLVSDDIDLWLASLLCWQQIRPPGGRLANRREHGSHGHERPTETRKRVSTTTTYPSRDPAIIKVGNVMLWDKGVAISPRSIAKRPSIRDLRSGLTSWRRVSCILQDNGEFKLMTENDVTMLSIVGLSQLTRSAVQKLDRSVLEEDFCIVIFPVYSTTSKQLSIFRPVYLAFDTRVLFEVWFVLLRAFTVPELYGIEASTSQVTEILDSNGDFDGQMFRIERSIQVRVTGAKIQRAVVSSERHKKDRDPLVGHYLAETMLDGEIRSRTTVQTDTKTPFWREMSQFSELPASLPCLSVVLKRLDGDVDSFVHQVPTSLGPTKSGNVTETVCGAVDICLDKLEKDKEHEEWYPVYDEKLESIGSMLIRLEHAELIVLATRDYHPLSELLHRFSTGLTSQITNSSPGMLRRFSEIFLNIFQVSGAASEWLMGLVEDEMDGVGNQNSMKRLRFSRRIKSDESTTSASDREQLVRDMSRSLTGEANLLFRGNTLLTQALEFHMRRVGKEYLDDILREKIFKINELDPDCEVDPSRIEKAEDLENHWKLLIQLATELWHNIAVTANKLPLELRSILKYVRAVAEDRYGDFLRTVNYTSVSGFLFLRFICPAILNPKLFGLLQDSPRPRAQRTLTLIAKGLQALANVSSFGKKESWMEPMNKFLAHERQSFKEYIDQLCAVSSDHNAMTVPASYSTPVMILGRLSPNGREGFPSLPYLIDHQRNYAALVKLWVESHRAPIDDGLYVFEGELKEFHNICVGLQQRSDSCMAQVEMLRTSENESIATDDLAETVEKSSLLESLTQSYASSAVGLDTDQYRPPGSSGSDIEESNRMTHRPVFRDNSPLHQVSDGLDHHNPIGTIRAKAKGGKETRRFLGGLLGGKKPKEYSNAATVREKGRGKDDKGSRGILSNLSDSWQHHDTNTR